MGCSCVPEEVEERDQDAERGNGRDPRPAQAIEGDVEITTKSDELELVRGSGNVFRDLGLANSDKEHLRAQLAAEIIGIVRQRKLTQREAAKLTGLTQAEVSHIKNAKLTGFTIDRMVTVLGKLDRQVKMEVVRPRRRRSVKSA